MGHVCAVNRAIVNRTCRTRRTRTWVRALATLVALVTMRPLWADIYLRDEEGGGIALSNRPESDVGFVLAETNPAILIAEPALKPLPRIVQPGKSASRQRLAPLVNAAAVAHGLPADLLTAVIEVESNFNVSAVSPKGAVGLMQLMPQTARHLAVADSRDPAANIDGGARYLKELLGRFGNNLHLALAAYNAGPGAIQRRGAIPFSGETQRYVPQVIRRYHSLQSGQPD